MSYTIVSNCPAFNKVPTCPFSGDEETTKAVTANCPAFEEGCPFKGSDELADIYSTLASMPESHRVNGDHVEPGSPSYYVESALKTIHKDSIELEKQLGRCTVFEVSCPFRTVTCSDGQPLVEKLDSSLIALLAIPQDEMSPRSDMVTRRLKQETSKLHRTAENVLYVRRFLKGGVTREEYTHFLLGLYHVYTVMEKLITEAAAKGNVLCKVIDFPQLHRADALKHDIIELVGIEKAKEMFKKPRRPVVDSYCTRLESIPKDMLLAHSYTRYLGDLSGGQILGRAARKYLGDDCPINFYVFEDIENCQAFKNEYKKIVDTSCISIEVADGLVKESMMAYALNVLLFEEMDFNFGYATRVHTLDEIVRLAESNISGLKLRKEQNASSSKKELCPFMMNSDSKKKVSCPWPFVLMHDPVSGSYDHPMKTLSLCIVTLGGFGLLYRRFCYC
ncbi:hypothetical protein FOL47_009980 [Perkinsus chesapeaki]|uniref:Heme oxygenase 2 n=1 Tax=Perkinsus chesapeaki TaxID=330153 RepID=A0A7J6L5H9_PERCH|nr:hypothetical protein FOL47_009980 [Perkinsus chesapeaki]